ncbi:MAG: hypothetical protein AAGF11_27575 [Myxococcota bacterium]
MSRAEDPAQALIDAAQRFDSPSAAVKARTWAAMQSRWAAGDQGPAVGSDPIPSPGSAGVGMTKGWLVVLGVVTVAAVGLGAALWGGRREPVPAPAPTRIVVAEPVAEVDETPPESSVVRPVPTVPRTVEASSAERPSVPGTRRSTRRPRAFSEARAARGRDGVRSGSPDAGPETAKPSPKSRAEPASGVRTQPDAAGSDEPAVGGGLGIEVALMSRARRALGRGQPARALKLLEQHRTQFPRGTLARERELSRVTALCELGREADARAAATKFLAQHPSEALRRQLARRCVGELPR